MAKAKTAVSNLSITRLGVVGCEKPLSRVVISYVVNKAMNSRGNVVTVSSRDLTRYPELLLLAGVRRRLRVQDRVIILNALRMIAKVYGIGEMYANNTHYIFLDARRLRSKAPEELARELARIICEEGDEP